MTGHDVIGLYNWTTMFILKKPGTLYIGALEFCLDWVFKMPVHVVNFQPKPHIDRHIKHLFPTWLFSLQWWFFPPIKFNIAHWNKKNLDTTSGGLIFLNKAWSYRESLGCSFVWKTEPVLQVVLASNTLVWSTRFYISGPQ